MLKHMKQKFGYQMYTSWISDFCSGQHPIIVSVKGLIINYVIIEGVEVLKRQTAQRKIVHHLKTLS